jgi:tetratricopeptide (TPR) repeat protein
MKFMRMILGALAFTLLLAVSGAAQTARIAGEVLDMNGKEFPGVVVQMKSEDFGTVYEAKTDEKGRFSQGGLRPGKYTLTFVVNGQTVYHVQVQVNSTENAPIMINFKELLEKDVEAKKKREEERLKFENMKGHFDTGVAALNQARTLSEDLKKTPPAERAPIQEKLSQAVELAITELETAKKAAGQDPNLHRIMAQLGQAYELVGRNEDAAAAFQQAVALKPDPGYYLALGTAYARLEKAAEATAACDSIVPLDKTTAATCYRNIGIIYYNSSKMGEAVEPLKKATNLDPNNAQGWYLLGASLVNTMGFKTEGDKVIPILQPGTVEAYEKCIELDPNGPYGAQAKQGLEQLEAMGLGISTKVKAKKK